MSEELKWGALVTVILLAIIGGMVGTCNHKRDIDSKAPIVETCIKHPATNPPFINNSN